MRYNNTNILKNDNNKRYYQTTSYPQVNPKQTDIYVITTSGDRLDILAEQYYNDSRLWWIIASSNNIRKDSLYVAPGTQIRIPTDITEFLKDFRNTNVNK